MNALASPSFKVEVRLSCTTLAGEDFEEFAGDGAAVEAHAAPLKMEGWIGAVAA